jgi:subtilase family protein
LGIIVVESAGNGDLASRAGNDLDEFKVNGKKIFNRHSKDFKDSGAIIVGAATSTVPHERIHYSNYGNRIDCYAWGENVATTGGYPRSSGTAINMYTQNFSGTSAAAAIIAGVALSVQSICEANMNLRLSPAQMRILLSNHLYGTPSANGKVIDKIGVMPDLKKIIEQKLNLNLTPDTTETAA